MIKKQNYWDKREKEWINSQIRKDMNFDKIVAAKYDELELQCYKDISSFYTKYAKTSNITFEEARKRVDSADIDELSKEAARMVKEKDFSQYANDRMKLYNATMRINRQSMLASQLGMESAKVTNGVEGELRSKLENDIYDEAKRQAGILAKSVPPKIDLRVKSLVDSSYQGATFSQRLWTSNDQLVNRLGEIVNRGLIQGMNPTQLSTMLRPLIKDNVKNAKYVAQRIARTESTRVSTQYRKRLYKDEGFDKAKWIAEPTACKFCLPEDRKIYDLDDINIPMHPNCRCSFIPVVNIDSGNDYLTANQPKRKLSTNSLSVNNKIVNTKKYHDKFYSIGMSKLVTESVYVNSIKILNHRGGTNYEDLYAIDSRTGEPIVKQDKLSIDGKVGLTQEQYANIIDNSNDVILIHNHPNSSRPSYEDIKTLYTEDKVDKSIIISHNGSVQAIELTKRNYDIERIYDYWYNKFRKEGLTRQESNLKATDKVYESGAINYVKK